MMTAWDYLKQNMAELGIEPKRSLGQNFLVSDHVIEKIIKAVGNTKPESLVEVGPGLGALTRFLMECCKDFQVIEFDSVLCEFWRRKGLSVNEADALKFDWGQLKLGSPATLVSNLPYQISASLVIDRSIDDISFDFMILMFQKEVAQRIRAQVAEENYGMLSVVAQTFWKIETLLEASSRDFFPPPKVASRVLTFKAQPQSQIESKLNYLKLVKAAFLHPRKLMVSNLREGLGITKEQSGLLLEKVGLEEKVRAGHVSVPQFIKLFREWSNL